MSELLTRDQFRASVFARDNDLCVNCGNAADDAHHILERRLFTDGGYYTENGASLCESCHLLAEETTLTPADLRIKAGITKLILPSHFEGDGEYDKWGNEILPNGTRAPGELFYDESVQKVLAPYLYLFINRYKYPRTPHLPWSPGYSKEDINWKNDDHMQGIEVVVTLKMDGENTTLYQDGMHARSIAEDAKYHVSRTWIKNLHGQIAHEIPEGYRICGENLYAKHSIGYEDLASYYMVFSIWNGMTCLSWDETKEWAELLGLTMIPVLYRGVYDSKLLQSLDIDTDRDEGYVVRPADSFGYNTFRKTVAKWVRADHLSTDRHWYWKQVEPNRLRG